MSDFHNPDTLMKIHIFNPDTDFALASGSDYYNMPKSVRLFTEKMAMFPETFAEPEDLVVPYHEIGSIKDVIEKKKAEGKSVQIAPWGWNAVIRTSLLRGGVPEYMLPTKEDIDNIRNISHRRTTIEANKLLNETLRELGFDTIHFPPLPLELKDADTAMNWLSDIKLGAFFKAPWSSSGRGVIFSGATDPTKLKEWIGGTIRRQGSVMAETAADKAIDFATEWIIDINGPIFLGLSLFSTSFRGKYQENRIIPQHEMLEEIRKTAPDFGPDFIEAQRRMLSLITADKYRGPLGVDMLACHDGAIRGCIEINFRMTMGHAALLREKKKL